MPRSQAPELRPIAFALNDTVHGAPTEVFTLSIRPEDLVRSEPSNMAVVQTLGGAWADTAGPGLATCTISGTTGWGAGGLPDGFEQFQKLHQTVFQRYHELRAKAVEEGKDPDGVKLIFSDGLNDFAWVVGPQVFNLRRNRSRPLLSQYQISLTKLADDVVIQPAKSTNIGAADSSLAGSIAKINTFAANIKADISTALGPLSRGVKQVLGLTSTALTNVRALAAAGKNVSSSAFAPVLEVARDLTKVSTNVMAIASSSRSLPLSVKRDFIEVKAALNNANCLLHNAIKAPTTLPDYSALYGASNCSSTAGGRPASPYADVNVFPSLFPAQASPVSMSAQAEAAVNTLSSVDLLNPPSTTTTAGLLESIGAGAAISTEAVNAAIAAAGAGQTKIMGATVAYI